MTANFLGSTDSIDLPVWVQWMSEIIDVELQKSKSRVCGVSPKSSGTVKVATSMMGFELTTRFVGLGSTVDERLDKYGSGGN